MNAIAASEIKTLRLSIYRYDPLKQEKPYMQDFDIDIPAEKDLMVLDVLMLAKEQDPSISFRRSCREGVCGSDGLNINCLLYTSPSPRDTLLSRMPSSA